MLLFDFMVLVKLLEIVLDGCDFVFVVGLEGGILDEEFCLLMDVGIECVFFGDMVLCILIVGFVVIVVLLVVFG